ncbi:MAG: LytR/AlgR family response regulator transcription factor, partial [Flavisolibacter sp.]
MNKLKAIIIDDEASSRNSLRQKLNVHCTEVEIIAECESGETGIKTIEETEPDIVFLDVEMPGGNGFKLLDETNRNNFEIIFVTSYGHYAIPALRYSAIDYLLKPVEIEELKNAVSRVEARMAKKNDLKANY